MAKKKPPTIAQEVEKAAVLLQELVRLKAADDNGYCRCVTCGISRQWNDQMQGAHFIGRGRTSTKLQAGAAHVVENVHPACSGCNKFYHATTLGVLAYRRYMVDMYGEGAVDELEALSRTVKKYNRAEVADIKSDFQAQIKFHKTRIGA